MLLAALAPGPTAAQAAGTGSPAAAVPAAIPASAQPVVVPLTANGTAREPVTVLVDGADVWMAADDLVAAGMLPRFLPAARARQARGHAYYRLRDMQDLLDWRFDAGELTLQVDLVPSVMTTHAVDLRARDPLARSPRVPSAYLNYSVTGGSSASPALFLEGVGSAGGNTFLGYLTRDSEGRASRGPMTLILNDEPSLRQTLVGDSLWPGSGLLGAVPVGGLTWQSNFAYDPALVTTPTLDMRGVATTPSTVDVLVNGALVARRQVPAGPFELGNIVAQSGSNNVTAVVRDAFGRETQVGNAGFYGSPLLLQPGLTTFAVSAGAIRQDRVGAGPAYRSPAVLAQALHGITPTLSAGAAVQASAAIRTVAAQVATTNAAGEFAAQAAHGQGEQAGGMALALSYRLSTRNWSLAAAFTRRQRDFRELAWSASAGQTLRADEFSLGRSLLGVDWSLRWAARETSTGDRLRRLALSATRRWTAWLTTSLELARTQGSVPDTSVFLLVSFLLDPLHSAYVTTSRTNGHAAATVDLVRMRQQALSTGYRLSSSWADGTRRQLLQVNRDTAFGDYEVQASGDPSGHHYNLRASGSLLTVGGEVGVAPPITDAFALVRVPDSPGVPVKLEGRLAGLTGPDGTLVVTGLSSYSNQRISIDSDALPLDFEVGEVERRVSAPYRGGELLEFEARPYRAYAGRLAGPDGQPVGSAIIEAADGRRASTGTQGDFVFEGTAPTGTARVVRAGGAGTCTVRFPATDPRSRAPVQRLGDLPCRP